MADKSKKQDRLTLINKSFHIVERFVYLGGDKYAVKLSNGKAIRFNTGTPAHIKALGQLN